MFLFQSYNSRLKEAVKGIQRNRICFIIRTAIVSINTFRICSKNLCIIQSLFYNASFKVLCGRKLCKAACNSVCNEDFFVCGNNYIVKSRIVFPENGGFFRSKYKKACGKRIAKDAAFTYCRSGHNVI